MSNSGKKECYQIRKRSKSEHCQGLHWWLETGWESRRGLLWRYPNNFPKQAFFYHAYFFHLGIHSSVFQAEVLAIPGLAKNLLLEKMHNQNIVVLVDSQVAIKSLIKCTVTSITELNRVRNLNQLGKQSQVSIAWIPGHAGVHGDKVVDYLAKSESKSNMQVLNLLLQSRMPVVLARLRTVSQIDEHLWGINAKTLEDERVCRLDVLTTNNTSP